VAGKSSSFIFFLKWQNFYKEAGNKKQMSKRMADTPLSPTLKSTLELGPILVFVLVNFFGGKLFSLDDKSRFMVATLVFMVAITLSLLIHYRFTKEWPIVPILMAVPVLLFGGLTLYFDDERFLKLKPSVINILIGLTLLIGLYFKKNLLSYLFQGVFALKNEGWRILTQRYALFCFAMAAVNEFVWRTQSTDFWVGFKFWGFTTMTIAFMMMQAKLLNTYKAD
jgi:intracellular septation protein